MDAIEISLLANRLNAICEEMGAILRHSALSPNIRDRGDYSCALFDVHGELVAQAAHIPVHLGSMGFAMRQIVSRHAWREGDVMVFNEPSPAGTHLPDITLLMPVFAGAEHIGFTASRAHHADVGGVVPGSMGLCRSLKEEGVVIAPGWWWRDGKENPAHLRNLLRAARDPSERLADLSAQRAACLCGCQRMRELHDDAPLPPRLAVLMQRAEAYGRVSIARIPDGVYEAEDALEDDGFGHEDLRIRLRLTICGEQAELDFSGTVGASEGPFNCPLAVTAAAVSYVFRCLMPEEAPQSSAIFRCLRLRVPPGCLLDAQGDVALAGGSVETSQRIVDVLLAALHQALPEAIPAAAQGTMNNTIFGGEDWTYYETLAGGMGASPGADGATAVQCHMTNTANTSIEVLESRYPLRVHRYAIRHGSGGAGLRRGGDGLVREWEVLAPCTLSLLGERRRGGPPGLAGGHAGQPGENACWRDGHWRSLPAKCCLSLKPGDRLRVCTPGGGGYGAPREGTSAG